jgi:hypothetical protein
VRLEGGGPDGGGPECGGPDGGGPVGATDGPDLTEESFLDMFVRKKEFFSSQTRLKT